MCFGLFNRRWCKKVYSSNILFNEGIIKNYNVILNGKNFYDQAIDSDIKRYKWIIKLTTGQDEDHTTRCLLDYENIKNHSRLLAVDLSRKNELVDADTKAIQHLEFVRQLKKLDANDNANDAGNDKSMFVLTILQKLKEARLRFV